MKWDGTFKKRKEINSTNTILLPLRIVKVLSFPFLRAFLSKGKTIGFSEGLGVFHIQSLPRDTTKKVFHIVLHIFDKKT